MSIADWSAYFIYVYPIQHIFAIFYWLLLIVGQ